MSRTLLIRFKLEQPRGDGRNPPPRLDSTRMLVDVERQLADAVQSRYGDVDVSVTAAGVNEIRLGGAWAEKAPAVREAVGELLSTVMEHLDTSEYVTN